MRIFYAVPRAAWVELNLQRSLEAMGHELITFTFPGWPDDSDPDWRAHGKPRTNQRLVETFAAALREGPIDLFFGYFYNSVVYPETIDRLRESGVPTVNFSCNNVHQFELVAEIAPRFDYCVVPELAAVAKFAAVGAQPLRIQLAANPSVYRPYPLEREFDVAFVGQRYADRADYLYHLAMNGVSVRAWGAGWQPRKRVDVATIRAALALVEDEKLDGVRRVVTNWLRPRRESPPVASATTSTPGHEVEAQVAAFGGPRLLHNDLVRMFSRARLSLGFATAGDSHLGPNRLTHLRLREFEAPMAGALYLTEFQEELDEYFRIGEEMLCYRDKEDLLEQTRYYLAHPEQAERVRRAGWHRARRDHTWARRFEELFREVGLRA